MGGNRKPKIFISYSWDSDDHKERVKKFVDELNAFDKFEIEFDGYLKSTPTGGLKSWMQEQVQDVHLVLMICTKRYYDFFENNVPPKKGKGVRWESKFIKNEVYNYNKDISQFFPIILKPEDYQYIPTVFSTDCHYYDLSKNEIEKLKDALEDKFNEISGDGEIIDTTLDDLKKTLKRLVSKEELKLYATNLLNFSSIHLPDDFDSIVDHLYDHRKPLLCLLKQLDDNRLAIILKKLQNELHISDSELENFDCMKKDMRRKRCNLLITLEPENDNNEHTKVEIWKDEKPYPYSVYQGEINLSNEKNPTGLVDEIFKHITVSSNDVLIEFIIPYELRNIDFSIWHNSRGSNLGRKFKIVRRLSERMEKSRTDDNAYEDWKTFWEWYQNKKSEKLKKLAIPVKNKNDIFFSDFEEKPYIKCKNPIDSEEMYKAILDETACIVLAPLKEGNTVKQLCSKIGKKDKLENLIKVSYRSLRDEIPYLLIWDNPNRIPKRYRHNNTKTSTEGE